MTTEYNRADDASTARRQRLPNRRAAVTFEFDISQRSYTATVGYFVDGPLAGKLAEVFLNSGHAGSDVDAAARDSAILCSLALQYGADIQTVRRALLRDARGIASSPLGVALDILTGETML